MLSRAHCDDIPCEDLDSGEVEAAVHVVLKSLSVSEPSMKDLQSATAHDSQLQHLKGMIDRGWPNNTSNLPQPLYQYWKVREDFMYVANNLGNHLVVPSSRC